MDSFPDYYAALGVGPSSTQQEISRAYRALMRKHHPDVDGGAEAGGQPADRAGQDDELLKIMQAFAILRDPKLRGAYDRGITAREIPDRTSTRAAPQNIPVRRVRSPARPSGHTIRITPVRWESGPWA